MNKQDTIKRIRENFPSELKDLAQWVCYRIEARDSKPTKIPYSVDGHKAASDNPATWTTFDAACKAYLNGNYNGVGFVFSEHDPYVGVDLDKCVRTNGEIEPEKLHYIDQLASYTERSQSGTGIHVIIRAMLPPGGRKSNQHQIEMYDRLRFFVVTGDVLPDYHPGIEERQAEIEQLHKTIFPAKPTEHQPSASPTPSNEDDQTLLNRMFASRNGTDIQALWLGNTAPYNGDESAADLALCNHLAFWTGNDAARIDSLFRQSRLYREHKWGRNARTGETYGAGTIARAIAATHEVYTPTNSRRERPENAQQAADPGYTKAPETPADNHDYLLSEGAHDEGNAQCVNARYQGRFAQNGAFGWIYHTGTHWTQDGAEEALERAITETLTARIGAALKSGKADQYKDLISKSIPNSSRVQGAKSQLSSLVYAPVETFDNSPDLLNCKNGVVNLRTGELIPHEPTQRFTHCVNVSYNPRADYAAWLEWLTESILDGHSVVDWLQMAVGYSLTGHTREEILFYLYGPPRSGKGTFTETLLALLGSPLAKEVNFATFTAERTGDSQNFDLAPLKPCRFVAASESNAYERFNEAKIKALTGGNEVYCAFKHHSHFNYKPQFKIWLSSNQPANADPDDDAVWGRLRMIEFPHSHLGEENKTLKASMCAPRVLEGVLAWAIAGAIRWYQLGSTGLPELETSKNSKNQHREALDNVQGWLGECCIIGGDGFTANSFLYLSYERWCKENGIEPKRQKGFSQALIRKGFREKRTTTQDRKTVRGFTGIGLG